jgi:energy-coupling factor transport system substrate-specific component
MTKQTKAIKDIALISILASILFVQQIALSFIPNVQFSTLLVVLYAKVLGFKKTTMIILIHVLMINLLSPLGPVIPLLIPAMIIAWILIPIILSTILRKVESTIYLAIFGLFFGFIYGWVFIPFVVLFLDAPFQPYLLMDIPFEIVMGISNFITILWLYEPLKKVLTREIEKYQK